jgi:hypothetical protein
LIVMSFCAWGATIATPLSSEEEAIGPGSPRPREVCIDAGLADEALDDLIRDAMAVLRQSGYEPAGFRLEMAMETIEGAGLDGRGSRRHPAVVFIPVEREDRHPLRVGRTDPCVVSWVWTPQRFTGWQRRVIERAREILRDAWPAGSTEQLSRVKVTETATEVSVHLTLGDPGEAAQAPSEAEITLRKRDLSAVD